MAKLSVVAEMTAKGHKSVHTYTSSTDNKTKDDAVLVVKGITDQLTSIFDMENASVHCDLNFQTDNMWVRRLKYSNGVTVITNAILL